MRAIRQLRTPTVPLWIAASLVKHTPDMDLLRIHAVNERVSSARDRVLACPTSLAGPANERLCFEQLRGLGNFFSEPNRSRQIMRSNVLKRFEKLVQPEARPLKPSFFGARHVLRRSCPETQEPRMCPHLPAVRGLRIRSRWPSIGPQDNRFARGSLDTRDETPFVLRARTRAPVS